MKTLQERLQLRKKSWSYLSRYLKRMQRNNVNVIKHGAKLINEIGFPTNEAQYDQLKEILNNMEKANNDIIKRAKHYITDYDRNKLLAAKNKTVTPDRMSKSDTKEKIK